MTIQSVVVILLLPWTERCWLPYGYIIYIVSEEWNGDGGCGSDIFVYTDQEGAKAKFRQLVRDEKRDGAVSEWLDMDDFMEESTEIYYSAWLDNDYDGYHYNLFLEEKEIIRTLTIV